MELRRVLKVAFSFLAVSLYQIIFHGGDILYLTFGTAPQSNNYNKHGPSFTDKRDTSSTTNNSSIAIPSRLAYIRPPGDRWELQRIFEELSATQQQAQLPSTAKGIATRYGIPTTPRNIQCYTNGTTTIGWIPSETSFHNTTKPIQYAGKIPRIIFQSWKTNKLQYELCQHVLRWSTMNPEYDYFLFDDEAMDTFIRLEYGIEIFSSYACIKVGAAMCDVWRLMIIYLYGGLYFDFDSRLMSELKDWNWGNDRDVVTGRSCGSRKHPGGCAHQWGLILIYAPKHPVLYAAIKETLGNIADRTATNVYDIAFWAYYNGWRNGPYNQSYMPGWGDGFGGRVTFQDNNVKAVMVEGKQIGNAIVDGGEHWVVQKQIWRSECQ